MTIGDRANLSSFGLQGYIDATNDASKRVRFATVAVFTGSVLVLVGLLNSLDSSWMIERVRAISKPNSQYVTDLMSFDKATTPSDKESVRQKLFDSAVTAYFDTAFIVKAPLFGIAFDIDDLGVVGGLGLLFSLGFLWFSLTRELANIRWSRRAAEILPDNALRRQFYDLLAMRQVLSTPPPREGHRLHDYVSKALIFLPLAVQCGVVGHDWSTLKIGDELDGHHALIIVRIGAALLIVIGIVSWLSLAELRAIDGAWERHWASLGCS